MQLDQAELLTLIKWNRQEKRSVQDALMHAVQKKVYYYCKKMLKNEEFIPRLKPSPNGRNDSP